MKPISKEDAKRLALAHGARLTVDGRPVNSARLQVASKPVPKAAYMPPQPAPEIAKTIETPPPDPAVRDALVSINNFAASQFLLNDSTAKILAGVQEALRAESKEEPEKRPTQWVFKVKRDAQGLMETITATAKF